MWKVPAIVTIVLLLSSVVVPSTSIFAEPGDNSDNVPKRFVVVLKDGEHPSELAKSHQVEKLKQYGHALNGLAVSASSAQIEKIRNDPSVLFVEEDKEFNILAQSIPTGIDRINADLNSIANIDGVNDPLDVDIAIIDTGIDPDHPDLNIAGGVNFIGINPFAWTDGHGHGTHVSGTVGAIDNDIGVVGVAPGAKLWALKVLDNSGSGTLIDVIEGIDWVTANSDIIDVANLSLGGTGIDDGNCGLTNFDSMHLAICNSVAQGVVYVVAAGNSNSDAASLIPAAYDEVITVSALADFDGLPGGSGSPTCRTDVDDTLADFSNYGYDVDIAAPGVCIQSTWKGGGYVSASGTSMASPHVAGAAALYIIENGKPQDLAGAQQVKQGLLNSATPQNDPDGFTGDPDSYAEPLLNVGTSVSAGPINDIAVTTIDAPTPVLQGEIVRVDVTVVNQGDFDETFDLTVIDETNGVTIGTESINLGFGSFATLPFYWNTTLLSGNHTVRADSTAVNGETDISDNSKSMIVTITEPIHDVAAMDINAPTTANKNDMVEIQVTVDNLGGFEETFDVTLTDTTDSIPLGVKTVVVPPGSSYTESFSWDTSASSEGDHTLEAEASVVPDETDLTNNVKTENVTLEVPEVPVAVPTTVTITNPAADSTVNGKVTISASVSGFSGTIAVKFLVDGSLKKTLASGPYEYGWHTKGQSVGPHLLEVEASDTNGNSESDDITVNIPSKGKGSGKPSKKIASGDFGEKLIQQELQKDELKHEMKLDAIKKDEAMKNKIQNAFAISEKKDELIKTRNSIATLEYSLKDGDDKDKKLKELEDKKFVLLNELKIADVESKNGEISEDDIKKISQEIEEDTKSSSNSGNENNDDKGNSGKESSTSSASSDSGKSNKGKSDNSNKGGKGNSKK